MKVSLTGEQLVAFRPAAPLMAVSPEGGLSCLAAGQAGRQPAYFRSPSDSETSHDNAPVAGVN